MWTMLNAFMNSRICLGFFNALMLGTDYKSYWVQMKFFEILKMALRNTFKPTCSSLAFRSLWPLYLLATTKNNSFRVKILDYFILIIVVYMWAIKTINTLWSTLTIGHMFCIKEWWKIIFFHSNISIGQCTISWPWNHSNPYYWLQF
jgi:hypothetical protein